jgi:hypothetical protein
MTRPTAPTTPALDDEKSEIVRREFERKIIELQRMTSASLEIIANVVLADGVATPVAHNAGRPVFVLVSPPRGASATGRTEEVRDGSQDRNKYVVLKATGWGATITVDLAVL